MKTKSNPEVTALVTELKAVSSTEIKVTSYQVAEKFGKSHFNVMKAIRNLECDSDFTALNFECSTKINELANGKPDSYYTMTRDGFLFLCMGFTGKGAAKWKQNFIMAFNMMEQELIKLLKKRVSKKGTSITWDNARAQIKASRSVFTDVVKEFIEYAKAQGSQSADNYYTSLTKMEYSALELISYKEKVPKDFRDSLDLIGLGYLNTAELVCRQSLLDGIRQKMPYKDIYAFAKKRVLDYAAVVHIPKLTEVVN